MPLDALRERAGELDLEAAICSAPARGTLCTAIADYDQRVLACVATDLALSRLAVIIHSIPELDRRQATSHFDFAPFQRDYGQHHRGRRIRGRRFQPHSLLYMATLSAMRFEPVSKACIGRRCTEASPTRSRWSPL